jgi:hypothetical protein
MSTSSIAQEILQTFLAQQSLQFEWADDSIYQIATEYGLNVNLAVDDEADLIRAWTPLASEPPEEKRGELYAALLNINLTNNLTQGGALALDPEQHEVSYHLAYDLRHASAESFARFFATLTETASGLQAAIEALIADKLDSTTVSTNALRV